MRGENAEYYRLINKRNNLPVAERAQIARTVWSRTKGLLGKRALPAGEGLVITDCAFVHMFFMKFAIDLVFCSERDEVLALQENLKPWFVSRIVWRGNYVIELPVGAIRSADLRLGDQIMFS